MTTIERACVALILLSSLAVAGSIGILNYGHAKYDDGFADAIAAGKEQLDFATELARRTEDELRVQLRAQDDMASNKEKEHAESLAAAQRRMLTGVDSLRCPARTVSVATATEHRPAASGPEVDLGRPGLMPTASADLLGVAGDIAGLVRRYERLEQRFDACRALTIRQ